MQFKYFRINNILNFLKDNNLSINKRFGQNFLINSGVVDYIVTSSEINANDLAIEIGCGLGSLTYKIIETDCTLIGFEIDRAYVKVLNEQFGAKENFTLIEGDFLKKIDEIISKIDDKKYEKIVIFGNLPYNITTPILNKIFKSRINFTSLFFMVQKEVAERITSEEGKKTYGSLSVFCQFFTKPKIISTISPQSFYPQPRVNSSIVHFIKRDEDYKVENEDTFFRVARSLFLNRRKQIKNNIMKSPLLNDMEKKDILKVLEKVDISPNIRGEMLPIEKIIELANEIYRLNYC